jgi:hypothetical protein
VALSMANGSSLAGSLITSTDWIHGRALTWMVDSVDALQYLPAPLRPVLLDTMFNIVNAGDRIGGNLLHVYQDVVRKEL